MAKEYGQPFYTNKDGKVNGINERYWAALYARENRVLFDPDEKNFYRYADETGLWEAITPESIREIISGRILEISREAQQFTLEIQITQTMPETAVHKNRQLGFWKNKIGLAENRAMATPAGDVMRAENFNQRKLRSLVAASMHFGH
jgi:hypothetical protein